MRNVIYVAPFAQIQTTARFAAALRTLRSVRLLGVFSEKPPAKIARIYDDFVVVDNVLNIGQLASGVGQLVRAHGKPHRILGILEDLQIQLATMRERWDLPGETIHAASQFRDKVQMKAALRQANIPCANYRRLLSEEDACSALKELGLPQVWKPPSGAGCKSTFVLKSAEDYQAALKQSPPSPSHPVLAEEFLTGVEHSFESICVGGEVVFESICRYLPGPLEVLNNDWIQWVCVLPRRLADDAYQRAAQANSAALKALGMASGMTHMEWFLRPDGTLAIGEIAMRPPGANFCDAISHAYETDIYRAWARAAVDDAFDGPYTKKKAVAIAYLRGTGRGRVVAVEGLREVHEAVGPLIVQTKLPTVGAPRSSHYEGDGYIMVAHPTTEGAMSAIATVIRTLKVRYA